MERPLRILHLEDDPADAELIQAALRAGQISCAIRRVATRQDFESALHEEEFDLILSDHTLPAFDGLSALKIARELRPETTFIFISGTIGEERAVESLRCGATDYVLKDRLGRLASAIRRALTEATERGRRQRAEEALRDAQERLRHVLARSPAVLYALKVSGGSAEPNWVSDNLQGLLGYSPEEARQPDWWRAVLHPQDSMAADADRERLFNESQTSREYRVRARNGEYRWVRDDQRLLRDADGHPNEIIGSWLDITERKQLEERLRQSQKMEAIGQLAGGVAHDFNNLLTVIRGNTELFLMSEASCSDESRDWLKEVVAASDRAANLTRQLLAFGRKQVMRVQPLQLNDVVGELTKMLHRLIGPDIRLRAECGGRLPLAQADPGMIEQVLMNLVVNARDAMPKGGDVVISTRAVTLDAESARTSAEARAGEFVCLSVQDTGCGIEPELLPRIFEPFFTTKAADKGTGLGLATVYGITKQHRGWLEVASEVGKGTTFTVFLPVAPNPAG